MGRKRTRYINCKRFTAPLAITIPSSIECSIPSMQLHLHLNYQLGIPSELVAIKTKLGRVIFGGKQIQKGT